MPLNAGSQGKGAATGDLAIAALDPTHLASERQVTVTDCSEFWNAAPGPCGDPLSPRNETPAQPEYSFTKQRELCTGAGLATREGRGYPGSSHTPQEHFLALVYNAVRYINQ